MVAEISVIMPVYNAGEYLREALDCVLAQDFTAYKMYCVDDCSDDGSYEILLEYEQKDKRIRVFRNPQRMGAAYSRNFALKMVDGRYVKFVDADDVIEPNLFSLLYEAITVFHADVAYCEWDKFQGNIGNITDRSLYPQSGQEKEQLTHPHQLNDLPLNIALQITNAPWAFLIRSEFLKEKSLEFQSLPSRNDVYFLELVKMLAEKLVHTSSFKALVHQRVYQSIFRIGSNPNPMDIVLALDAIKDRMLCCKIWEDYRDYYFTQCICLLRHAILTAGNKEKQEQFLIFLRKKGLLQLGVNKEAIEKSHITDKILYFYNLLLNGTVEDIVEEDFFYNRVSEHKNSICRQLHNWRGKKVVFWGVGRRMQFFWDLFEEEMEFSICFVDARKAGKIYKEREIVTYGQVANKNDIIVILNRLYEQDIMDVINHFHGEEQVFSLERFIEQSMPVCKEK